jgi:hypothetical protein
VTDPSRDWSARRCSSPPRASFGTTDQNVTFTGLGGNVQGEGQSRVTRGSCVFDGCALLSGHIRREENELFEQIQRVLPREVLDRAGSKIDGRAVRVCL